MGVELGRIRTDDLLGISDWAGTNHSEVGIVDATCVENLPSCICMKRITGTSPQYYDENFEKYTDHYLVVIWSSPHMCIFRPIILGLMFHSHDYAKWQVGIVGVHGILNRHTRFCQPSTL